MALPRPPLRSRTATAGIDDRVRPRDAACDPYIMTKEFGQETNLAEKLPRWYQTHEPCSSSSSPASSGRCIRRCSWRSSRRRGSSTLRGERPTLRCAPASRRRLWSSTAGSGGRRSGCASTRLCATRSQRPRHDRIQTLADSREIGALQRRRRRRYILGMATEDGEAPITRREWLQARLSTRRECSTTSSRWGWRRAAR